MAYSATLTKSGPVSDESFVGELFVMDSDCGKFKLRDCPPVLCKNDTSSKCQAQHTRIYTVCLAAQSWTS